MEGTIRKEELNFSTKINGVFYNIFIVYLVDIPIAIEIEIDNQRISSPMLKYILYFLSKIRKENLSHLYSFGKHFIYCIYDNETLYLKNFNRKCLENDIIRIPIDWDNFDTVIYFCKETIQNEKDFFSQ